jgi:hypothetical protein
LQNKTICLLQHFPGPVQYLIDLDTAHAGDDDHPDLSGLNNFQAVPLPEIYLLPQVKQTNIRPGGIQRAFVQVGSDNLAADPLFRQVHRQQGVIGSNISH